MQKLVTSTANLGDFRITNFSTWGGGVWKSGVYRVLWKWNSVSPSGEALPVKTLTSDSYSYSCVKEKASFVNFAGVQLSFSHFRLQRVEDVQVS